MGFNFASAPTSLGLDQITYKCSLGKCKYLVQPNHCGEVVHLGRHTGRLFERLFRVWMFEVLVIAV
jgi:hypothetical protein